MEWEATWWPRERAPCHISDVEHTEHVPPSQQQELEKHQVEFNKCCHFTRKFHMLCTQIPHVNRDSGPKCSKQEWKRAQSITALRGEVTFTCVKRPKHLKATLQNTQMALSLATSDQTRRIQEHQQFTSKLCSDERRILHSHEGCHICLGNRRPESTTELLGSCSVKTLWTSNTSAITGGCLWDKSSSLFILFHLLKHIWIVQFYSRQGGVLGQSHTCYLHVFRYILEVRGILGRNSSTIWKKDLWAFQPLCLGY